MIIGSRTAADLEPATVELRAASLETSWIAANCADENDVQQSAQQPDERLARIDILVDNAGAAWAAPAEDHPSGVGTR